MTVLEAAVVNLVKIVVIMITVIVAARNYVINLVMEIVIKVVMVVVDPVWIIIKLKESGARSSTSYLFSTTSKTFTTVFVFRTFSFTPSDS